MRFAVHQPNFCPWLGYFLKLYLVDTFVILDDVQMPIGRSYVSRTKIRGGPDGTWLSVSTSGPSGVLIRDVPIAPSSQGNKQRNLNLIESRYRSCEHFANVYSVVERAYARDYRWLIELNLELMTEVMSMLGIPTPIVMSSSLNIETHSDERIAQIGRALGASTYLSGAGGSAYQSEETYRRAGLKLATLSVPKHIEGLENVGFSILEHLMSSGPQVVRAAMDAQASRLDQ